MNSRKKKLAAAAMLFVSVFDAKKSEALKPQPNTQISKKNNLTIAPPTKKFNKDLLLKIGIPSAAALLIGSGILTWALWPKNKDFKSPNSDAKDQEIKNIDNIDDINDGNKNIKSPPLISPIKESNDNNESKGLNIKSKNTIEKNNNDNKILIKNNEEKSKQTEPEIDAEIYILESVERQINKKLDEMNEEDRPPINENEKEKYKSNFEKIKKMLKTFFDNLKQNKYENDKIDKGLVDYFNTNGTSKFIKKNIKKIAVDFNYIFIYLDFNDFAYCIGINVFYNKLILRASMFTEVYMRVYRYCMQNYGVNASAKKYFEVSESELLQ